LTEKTEIKIAYEQLKNVMYKNTEICSTIIGYKGENRSVEVAWHRDVEMWNCFMPNAEGRDGSFRYWCSYGLDNPHKKTMVGITAEINMPEEGYSHRIAAVFAKNQKDEIFLIHSGKVGGGRKGIGKNSFRDFYRGNQQVKLLWPDGKETEDICIGKLNDSSLRIQVAYFIKEVSRYKKFVVEGILHENNEKISIKDPMFTPEFSGERKNYVLNGTVESTSYHGQVVGALNKELEINGFKTANDHSRDLFILKSNKMAALFEIKTDITTTSIYGSIGQLMYHSVLHDPMPLKILVIPGKPDSQTKTILEKLGIEILEYIWRNNIPAFKNFNEIIKKIC
jgi:hypothetical protein